MSLPSGTVTFMFTDIEGSTAKLPADPEGFRSQLAEHDALEAAPVPGRCRASDAQHAA